ncbi:hypothetical protein [Hyunsoonleella aestuarii]|uniref:Uncharacterized protein n=1 Tax=Hyunsoonleella aestuarii TaxID=912802 RepID=A0ABP8EDJ4_9FLAO|nr:hypothetical protein [Hyunsoonleella aestuarii]
MIDFLLEYKSPLTFILEMLAAVTGLVLYGKYKYHYAKYFIWFIVYLFICDSLGGYYKNLIRNDGVLSFLEGTVFVKNYWWFTIFWKIGAILFFAFYYNKILQKYYFRRIAKISGSVFFIFSIFHVIMNLEDYFKTFLPAISIFGAIVIFIVTVLYFIELLQSERILTFYKSLNFYITFTIFIWWLMVTPLVFYDIYMSNLDNSFIFLRTRIYLFGNLFMYSMFVFALIFCKPEKETLIDFTK